MKIKARLMIILFMFSAIPAVFISLLLFEYSRWQIEENAVATVKYASYIKGGDILELLDLKLSRTVDFSVDKYARDSLRLIASSSNPEVKQSRGRELGEYLRRDFKPIDPDLIEIHILDRKGIVVASTDDSFIGRDESAEQYFRDGLKKSTIEEIGFHEHGGLKHAYIPIASPILVDGEPVGVLMNGYGFERLAGLIKGEGIRTSAPAAQSRAAQLPGLATYLANSRGILLTGTNGAARAVPFETRVDTVPVAECMRYGRGVSGEWADLGGKTVWGSSQCLRIENGPVWTFSAEQDKSTVLDQLSRVRYVVSVLCLSIVLVAGFTSYGMALSITRPIDELRKGAEVVATGDLGYRVENIEEDELGELSRAFNRMEEDLKKVTASRDDLVHETAERKKAIEALKVSETKYRNLVETSLAGIYRTNLKGDFLFINEALARIFEFESASEMMREGALIRYKNPEDRERFLSELGRTGRVKAIELEMVAKTGRTKIVLLSATLLHDIISGTAIDITERRRSEQIRKEAERSRALADISEALANVVTDYRGLLDTITKYLGDLFNVPCVLRLLSEDGILLEPVAVYHPEPSLMRLLREFIEANPQYADRGLGSRVVSEGKQLFFLTAQDVWDIAEWGPVLDRLGIKSVLVTPLRSGGRNIGMFSCYRSGEEFTPDEEVFIQELANRAALAISIGKLFRAIRHELSLRKHAEKELESYAAELERSNTELQQFAYIASHDLREPLRMIDGYLKLIERRYKGRLDPKADQFIGYAVSGAERMQHIIDDLLEYSRVRTQASPFEDTDVSEVLNQVLVNLQVAVKEAGAVVTHGSMPIVKADPTQLSQVFQNLISNAVKFSSPGKVPKVNVSAEEGEGEWVFSVADNGIGIDPRYRDKVFEIFQRLHGAEYAGTGIGLAICKRIVERHGGSIWVESQPGEGSTFFFTIPKKIEAGFGSDAA